MLTTGTMVGGMERMGTRATCTVANTTVHIHMKRSARKKVIASARLAGPSFISSIS